MAGSITATRIQHRQRGLVTLKATVTTDASGDASETVVGSAYGRIVAIRYEIGTLDATTTDITIRDKDSGIALVTLTNATASRYFRPTADITDNAGVAIADAATATDTNREIYVAGDLSVTVAQGGNAKTGKVSIIVDEGTSVQPLPRGK